MTAGFSELKFLDLLIIDIDMFQGHTLSSLCCGFPCLITFTTLQVNIKASND